MLSHTCQSPHKPMHSHDTCVFHSLPMHSHTHPYMSVFPYTTHTCTSPTNPCIDVSFPYTTHAFPYFLIDVNCPIHYPYIPNIHSGFPYKPMHWCQFPIHYPYIPIHCVHHILSFDLLISSPLYVIQVWASVRQPKQINTQTNKEHFAKLTGTPFLEYSCMFWAIYMPADSFNPFE